MTDKELLEAAAKAGGFMWWDSDLEVWQGGPDIHTDWDPLVDDGDAFQVAVKLRIEVLPYEDAVVVRFPLGPDRELHEIREIMGLDRYETTRRAIVRAAAEMGRV